MTGGTAADAITFATALTGGVVNLGAGTDSVTLASGTNSATISNAETISGGSGADTITLGAAIARAMSISGPAPMRSRSPTAPIR